MQTLIIGAGVAGPALGIFLLRAGFRVDVCEARQQDGEGAFLTLAPNGMHVLAQLGLAQQVIDHGALTHGIRFFNARGEDVGTIDNSDSAARYGHASYSIRRSALQRVLLEGAQREGVRVHFGKRLQALDGGAATFEDGSRMEADLVFGCDGIRSRTRTLVFPNAQQPAFTGLYDYGGMVEARGDEPLARDWMTMVFGKRAFFGVVPGAHGELWWFHNGALQQATREQLLAVHGDDPPFIRDLIARTPELLGPWPQHDILGLRAWHRERVCLLGDAAHATTPSAGQGASLALEDAALLARCLREQPEGAFATFQALREARVRKIVAASRRNGSGKAPGPLGAWFRDRMLSRFLKLGASQLHEAVSYQANYQ